MNPQTLEQSESKTLTNYSISLVSDSFKNVPETVRPVTYFSNIRENVSASAAEGFRDIDAIVADAEQNDEDRALLAEARQILAEKLYPGETSIRSLRLKAGLSQKSLADRMGTSQSHVARIEKNGESVELRTIVSLTRALGVDLCSVANALLANTNSNEA